jgi:hypothetical protein
MAGGVGGERLTLPSTRLNRASPIASPYLDFNLWNLLAVDITGVFDLTDNGWLTTNLAGVLAGGMRFELGLHR